MNLPACRSCGKSNDAHTHANASIPAVPHDRDFSMCLYCGVWSVFEGNTLREPTEDERNVIRTDPDCARAEFVFFMINRRRSS
jgi:hypothetical protein